MALASIIMSNTILHAIRRVLNSIAFYVRISVDDIKVALVHEIVKRDVIEGDKATKPSGLFRGRPTRLCGRSERSTWPPIPLWSMRRLSGFRCPRPSLRNTAIRILAGFAFALFLSGTAIAGESAIAKNSEDAEKAAAISKLEAEIEEANNRKKQAAKDDNRDVVKRILADLKSLRLQLSKAKSKKPEKYAEEAAAAEEQEKIEADKKRQDDEMSAFWTDPKGRATVAAARLYRDLQTFRRKPDFAQFGFGRGGPYHAWMAAAETVAARDGKAGALKMLERYDCSLGELAALGMAYESNGGNETAHTADVEKRLGPAMQAIEKEAEQRAREKSQSDAARPAATVP